MLWHEQKAVLNFLCSLPGAPRSTPPVLQTRLTCRTSSTECSRVDRRMTWLPTAEASFPQVRPITTRPVLEVPLSPLPRVRQVSSCRGAFGQIPARRGPTAANRPGGERRFENPSRDEVCLLDSVSKPGHDKKMAMFVSRLPVGTPRSGEWSSVKLQSNPPSRDGLDHEEEPVGCISVLKAEEVAVSVLYLSPHPVVLLVSLMTVALTTEIPLMP